MAEAFKICHDHDMVRFTNTSHSNSMYSGPHSAHLPKGSGNRR